VPDYGAAVIQLCDWDKIVVSCQRNREGIIFIRRIDSKIVKTLTVNRNEIPYVLKCLEKYEREGELRYHRGDKTHTVLEILTCAS
jgi:hypothetical protein